MQLPGQREDPAFIMDPDGNIMLAAGKTEQLFKKISITSISRRYLKAGKIRGASQMLLWNLIAQV